LGREEREGEGIRASMLLFGLMVAVGRVGNMKVVKRMLLCIDVEVGDEGAEPDAYEFRLLVPAGRMGNSNEWSGVLK
jgi:hypothetical protein